MNSKNKGVKNLKIQEMAEGTLKRVIAVRLQPGDDVLLSLEQLCKERNLQNGVILSAIGSLQGARFFNPVELPDKKAGYGYSEPITLTGPIELTNATGLICHDANGEILLHVHISLSDRYGNGHGGHLIEGNKVLLTVDMVLGELDGIDMGRRYDEELEVPLFAPKQMTEKENRKV